MPKSLERCSTNMSHSSKVPGSNNRSSRSRAVSLPLACCWAMRRSPPPSRAAARFSSNWRRISCMKSLRSPPRSTGIDNSSIAAQQAGKTGGERDVVFEPRAALRLLRILAPALDLKALIELRRFESRLGGESPLDQCKAKDQRAAGGHGEMECDEHHRIVSGDGALERGEHRLALRNRRDAMGDREPRIVARLGPIEQALPRLVLAVHQLGRILGAITEQVGRRIFRNLGDHFRAPWHDAIDRRADETRERQGERLHRRTLSAPLVRDRLGERLRRNHELVLCRGPERLAIELNGKAVGAGDRLCVAIEALHRSRTSSAKGSASSDSAKPKNFHVARICGGNGASAVNLPPRGCGRAIARA